MTTIATIWVRSGHVTSFTVSRLFGYVADWIFQNDWIANHKSSLRHPAAWVHGLFHLLVMLLIFPPDVSIAIALIHMVIDTRHPVNLWRRFYRQTADGPYAIHVAIWLDQVFHIAVLAFFVWIIR